MNRAAELALNLGRGERALIFFAVFVDHRVPDCSAELQPVHIDRAAFEKFGDVTDAAVVLIDEPRLAVADHDRRVAAGAIRNRRLDMNRNCQSITEVCDFAIARANELRETETAQLALEFAGCEIRQQHFRVLVNMLRQPRFIEVVAVLVRYI